MGFGAAMSFDDGDERRVGVARASRRAEPAGRCSAVLRARGRLLGVVPVRVHRTRLRRPHHIQIPPSN